MGEEEEVEAGTAEPEWWLWLTGEILVTEEPAFANGLSELPVNRVAEDASAFVTLKSQP